MTDTIFNQIIDKSLPANIRYEDDLCMAFDDINPQAPIHILIIPKKNIAKLADSQTDDQALLGHLLLVANDIAATLNISDHFRLVINNGEKAGQEVFHLHLHLPTLLRLNHILFRLYYDASPYHMKLHHQRY